MTDYLPAVFAMLGPAEERFADPAAWLSLEDELGRTLPADYKRIVDAYAPVQINGHLCLSHPASDWRNLGEEIRSTSATWSESAWEFYVTGPDDDPRVFCNLPQLSFGTAEGLVPLASTDQGAAVFGAPQVHGFSDGVVVQGEEGDWVAHSMTFAEWLYRYLIGEEMAGWDSATFYPGPVRLEYPPAGPGQRTRQASGPARGV
ncbi:SMI1/KNR4 family protein [Streptomyces sp. NBC_00841]|uniref:SMI1/KNR4 family protein n=1 Tax=unclassified Streptomyces TaxID=2593676 RepID=UPI00224F53BE|nr:MULTISPECIES: SMI1/KNR4 family protein [unclassified Streptomyces]MCX4534870.1 SMI1/KNR4 family protein [Streptomyces sp. NBC_01669]WRZ99803.1 SMI1/KNR4 family protein [Streptomyces sp. NBC_00841]